jgi:hypothetical protein
VREGRSGEKEPGKRDKRDAHVQWHL